MKNNPYKLTPEEIAAGVTISTTDDIEAVDVSDRQLEKMARGFILGSQAIGKRKEIKQSLEEKVSKKIGRKGKYLTDKLFELIEGVYVLDKKSMSGKNQTVRYYQVPPNLNAIIYALDRVLGKPKQQIESSEEKKGIILVEHVIRNLADNPYKNVGLKNEEGNIRNGYREGSSKSRNVGFTESQSEGVSASALQE